MHGRVQPHALGVQAAAFGVPRLSLPFDLRAGSWDHVQRLLTPVVLHGTRDSGREAHAPIVHPELERVVVDEGGVIQPFFSSLAMLRSRATRKSSLA